ncbi:MAG: DUF72 domain-containing protein [Bryobacteraceae bacterium]|nr:DUF72 domain-containing protein [Bryobacteraceae bacterium]
MPSDEPQLFAGTSGFAYPAWKPGFYPADVPAKRFLQHYASRLNSTEINYTYRRLPTPKSLGDWVESTPAEFVFSLKAHMKLTHVLRLKDCSSFLEVFLKAVDPLRVVRRLGPILFQLPPNLKADTSLLADFVALLPQDMRFAFEFRNASWLVDATYEVLSSRGICLCLAESDTLVIPHVLTSPFTYFRLRKTEYGPEELQKIGATADKLLSEGRDIYLYFKHEESPEGALYAEQVLQAHRALENQTNPISVRA